MGGILTGLHSLACGWGKVVRKYFPNQGIFALLYLFFLFLSFFWQVWLMVLTLQCLSSSAKYSPLERMCHKQNILFIHQNRQVNCEQFTTLHTSVFSFPARWEVTAEASSGSPVQAWICLCERGFGERFALTHSHGQWRCRDQVKRGVKAQEQAARRGLGVTRLKLVPCQRCSPPGLGTSPLLPAEDKLLLAGQRGGKQK